jgi:hypothetical protein
MNLGWKDRLIEGTLPSELLREEYTKNPDASAGQVAENFILELPGIDWRIAVFARRWKRDQDIEIGLGEDDLNTLILEIFKEWIKDNPA